ncbi:uncharacterized protein ATC70_005546 [Mucor velutinosus]|uniref:Nibrin second BRCT domain-containing protein n=1 Tax=Mucor velutinosus TaxID=708070 RepID=A0AAN7HLR9_9FUNG|nr:hypothetical protein ATC70_005546 [Mucor velutinosus]
MWFLSRIIGNARTDAKICARFKPNDTYEVKPKGSQDRNSTVKFRVSRFSEADVIGSRSKPDVILYRNGISVVVDGQVVTEDEKYLHDQQILHIGKGNSAYKISWEPVSIYHDKSQNPDVHAKLIKQGARLGFYVINSIKSNYDKPTHYCISINPELYQLSTFACRALASNNVYFIRPEWVEALSEADNKQLDIKAFNEKIQPITVDKFEGFEQTAIFGPDERRKRLFKRMEFWFFDQQQFNHFANLIKPVGGKVELKTCEQVLELDIEGNPLFVAPPDSDMLPNWPAVHEKYCKEMDVIRVLFDKEIMYAILFCSTNVMCNPASAPLEHMHPDSAVYASFESASLHPTSVKLESLDPTMPVTYPQDDMNYNHHYEERDDGDFIQVKPEPMESTQHNSVRLEQAEQENDEQQQQQREEHVRPRRVIKEEVHEEDQEMQEAHNESPQQQQQQQQDDLPDTVPVSMSPIYHSSPAFTRESPISAGAPPSLPPADEVQEEAAYANSPPPMSSPSISQQIEPINSIPASIDLGLDVDALLDSAFDNLQSQKKKDKEKRLQEEQAANKRRQEEERATQENRCKEEERQKLLQEQIVKERAEYEARLQERTDYNAGRGGHLYRDAMIEEYDEDDTHDPEEEEEEPLQAQDEHNDQEAHEEEQYLSAPTESHLEEAPLGYHNDPTVIGVVEPNPDQGQFSRIIYRNLEVNPRPPPPANGIVNYKKFKKVKQFENYSSFEQSQVSTAPGAATSSSLINNRRRARGKTDMRL